MKTIKQTTLILLVLPIMMMACNQEKVSELQEKNEELTQTVTDMDSSLSEYLSTFAAIDENLERIKEKQNLIKVKAEEGINEGDHTQLISDLKAIENLMDENKTRLAELQNNLENSDYKISQLQKMTNRLSQKLEEKDQSLAKMRDDLSKLTEENSKLHENLTALSHKADTLEKANHFKQLVIDTQEEHIEQQKDMLQTAYLAMGTSDELMKKKIITKEGGILGIGAVKQLNSNVSDEEFQLININEVREIPLTTPKAEIVTNHPSDSYKIEVEEETDISSLVITDPDKFWNTTKYLVVKVKN